jgi:PadR family transcriptional regulator PadR
LEDRLPEPLGIVKGTLDVLVLKALTWRPMHGFEVTAWLEAESRQRLQLEDAAIYQALYRMEKRGLIKAEWGVTEQNRRARYYQLTAAGKGHLRQHTTQWLQYAETVTAILVAARRRG